MENGEAGVAMPSARKVMASYPRLARLQSLADSTRSKRSTPAAPAPSARQSRAAAPETASRVVLPGAGRAHENRRRLETRQYKSGSTSLRRDFAREAFRADRSS